MKNQLKKIGIDTDSVIERLGGNEQLYLAICRKFLQDQNYGMILDALASRNMQAAEIHLHTLKGVATNLGFIRLQLLCRTLYDKIKTGDTLFLEETLTALSNEYHRIITIILQYQPQEHAVFTSEVQY